MRQHYYIVGEDGICEVLNIEPHDYGLHYDELHYDALHYDALLESKLLEGGLVNDQF